jgi:hypothetical protein
MGYVCLKISFTYTEATEISSMHRPLHTYLGPLRAPLRLTPLRSPPVV